MNFVLGFDGGNAQNISCYGYIVWCDDRIVAEGCGKCNDELQTNNVAEWSALMYGLMTTLPQIVTAKRQHDIDTVYLRGDSQLVLRQLTGEYSVTKPHLQFYCDKCRALVKRIEQEGVRVVTHWEGRDSNNGPDSLTHRARQRFLEEK